MTRPAGYTVLVVAKAPVAGRAKTRLGAVVGDDAAADVAAAALLDTLAAARAAVGADRCVVALTGDLDRAARGEEVAAALAGCVVVPQRGDGFDARLAHAHADAGAVAARPVVQVGMDTPQVTAEHLDAVAGALADHDAVLGAAGDGGWWVLGLRDAARGAALRGVPMSTPTTLDDTAAALRSAGLTVGETAVLRDVDTAEDAAAVALEAPGTQFAAAWAGLGAVCP
ncbi:TIGR04282 family arsenosugar biosynthesis glycosyltransferase [Nocardioides dongxiaopingii]|uniref:TIGR04282 family arsenosugar biosynthesis glycosyltransferase n=1 Tax=Nocardioides dongxiaopingii TaxID=2576036 RepID=UPI0010C764A8|nr:DUF2064 domain-containing protein [Nocardioides dongxiaopingii]